VYQLRSMFVVAERCGLKQRLRLAPAWPERGALDSCRRNYPGAIDGEMWLTSAEGSSAGGTPLRRGGAHRSHLANWARRCAAGGSVVMADPTAPTRIQPQRENGLLKRRPGMLEAVGAIRHTRRRRW